MRCRDCEFLCYDEEVADGVFCAKEGYHLRKEVEKDNPICRNFVWSGDFRDHSCGECRFASFDEDAAGGKYLICSFDVPLQVRAGVAVTVRFDRDHAACGRFLPNKGK